MLTSEIIAALQKVQSIAGDIPVVLRRVEDDVETELLSIGVHIDPATSSTKGSVALEHGAPAAPAEPAVAAAPETTAA